MVYFAHMIATGTCLNMSLPNLISSYQKVYFFAMYLLFDTYISFIIVNGLNKINNSESESESLVTSL